MVTTTPQGSRLQTLRMVLAAGLAYSALVMPMSSLSVYIGQEWGLSNFLAGLVGGAAFATTLLRRKPAGDVADRRGGRFCFLRGCGFHAVGGLICLAAALDGPPVPVRFAVLLAGRLIIGLGESMANIGVTHWLVGYMGPTRTGRTLATLGMSIYGSVAIGGRLGFYLFENTGYVGLVTVSTLMPLLGLALVVGLRDDARLASGRTFTSFGSIMTTLMPLGVAASCVAVGFPIVGTFLTKTFLDRGWAYAGWGFTCCGLGFITMRLLFGHLPDRIGGLRVALFSALLEMIGLVVLWLATGPEAALTGAFLTGAGISMVFPCLGMEIVKIVPAKTRGVSLSCYNLFIDISYGFAAPVAGMFTDWFGDASAYLLAAAAAGSGLALICRLTRTWTRRYPSE